MLNAGDIRDVGSIPGLGRSPGVENDNLLQDSCLWNPTDRGAWWGWSPWGCKELHKTEWLSRSRRRGQQWIEMVGCHHPFNGHEFEQTPGDSEGWGSLACCNPWGQKVLDMTEKEVSLKGTGFKEEIKGRDLKDGLELYQDFI